jgi:hypothetical protein
MIIYRDKHENKDYLDKILVVVAQIIIRCLIISVKYGYYSPLQIKQIKSSRLTSDEIASNFIANKWITLNQATIEEHIDGCIWRL